MKKRSQWLVLELALVCSALSIVLSGFDIAMAQEAPRTEPTHDQLEKRLTSVGTLIERSSAAKQIEASGVAAAEANRNLARQLHQQAEEAYRGGDYEKASRLLEEASKKMFEGVRLAAPEQITGQKKRRDFDNRMESVKALRDALKRVSAEKGKTSQTAEVIARIESMMKEADSIVSAGNIERGRVVLDQAYVTAKVSIENLRGGDTLVRSLKFASKEEEYRYEVDRNDTHQMLVKVLLEEKRVSSAIDNMVRKDLDQATSLRKTAEQFAAKGDYDNAIKTMEESTRELVRAIRGAGVYIPG